MTEMFNLSYSWNGGNGYSLQSDDPLLSDEQDSAYIFQKLWFIYHRPFPPKP